MYSPKNEEFGNNNYAPTSFRQRNLYFLHCARFLNRNYVFRSITAKLANNHLEQLGESQPSAHQPRKRRQRSKIPRFISPLPEVEAVKNLHKSESQFIQFSQNMFENGIVVVRSQTDEGGYLVTNACVQESGALKADSFVNVRYIKEPGNEIDIKCTCYDYKNYSGEAGQSLDPDGNWMSHRTQCMHVRFLYENLEEQIKSLPDVQISKEEHLQRLTKQLYHSSYYKANSKIVVLSSDNYLVLSITRKAQDIPSIVTLNPKNFDTICHGPCLINNVLRRPKKYWLENKLTSENACPHILLLEEQSNLIEDYLEKKRQKRPTQRKEKVEHFSKELQKWIPVSLKTHKPKMIDDPKYHA